MEEQRRGPSGPPSKTTLNELLDTLKLLEEEEPQRLPGPKFHHNDKYAWIDEVRENVQEPPWFSLKRGDS